MSDRTFDPRFESLLRDALKAEAASFPLSVGPAQILERAKVRHGYRVSSHLRVRSRLGLPRLSMAIAAGAAAVVLVVAGAVGLNFFVNQQRIGAPSPNPSPSPTMEPSVDLGIFAPVAGRIVYGSGTVIWGFDPAVPNDTTRVQLTADAGDPMGWSTDGTRLLSTRGSFGQQTLFILHADGSETQVTTDPMHIRGATISPDGSRVVFAGGTGEFPGEPGSCCSQGFALYAADANGGPAEVLIESREGFLEEPTFSPDGTQIAYVDGAGDNSHSVWVMNADGTDAHQIVYKDCACHVDGLVWSPAGDRIAIGIEGTTYTFATDGSGFAQLITHGDRPNGAPGGLQFAYTILWEVGFAKTGPWHPGVPAIDEPAPSPETTAPSPETTAPSPETTEPAVSASRATVARCCVSRATDRTGWAI